MRLLTLRDQGGLHNGVLMGEEVLDLVRARPALPFATCLPDGMSALLATGTEGLAILQRLVELAGQAEHRAALEKAGAIIPLAEVRFGPVVPDGDLLLSGSMNSRGHTAEMGDDLPDHPCAFHKVRSARAGSGDDIVPPAGHADMIDWEGELCVVIGARCHRVSVDEAQRYIAGYTLLNDISAREYVVPFVTASGASPVAQAWERNVLGKNYPTFAPIGPFIVTKDEVSHPFEYSMETLVNGEVMQSSTQEDLVFGPAEMISYFSDFYVFEPGDMISMGSPPGVGMARKPQVFLKPNDVVEVRVKEIGSLVNRVVAPKE